ncbi:uncharacterized protein LOC111245118 isoform X1 [Varroa destructor]|uniref:Glucose-methanol-choline oxidoreductase N-terminal domain-containing protein n=1 Tax=Varroa destructor TaxID=109461 RepID=A0A7M7MAX9_VARDE|nr:uncharacterized protein LOC111245118 isoform X1 [Varroa destructor]XP_022648751.1 uncharacterized protein LOC111245118 isoform X1 [Varroa destructor]XP_022648760.1 uncharacterized protein LOC111245118 isoform X1 [Varroa destructor]
MLVSLCIMILVSTSDALDVNYNGTCLGDLRVEYDFIIVGGGSAGCRVAEHLSSKESFKILLIEAGGVPPEFSKIPLLTALALDNPKFDWQYKTVPQKTSMLSAVDRVRTIASGRVLGGGSSINLMAYQRGDRDDYNTWESVYGAKGWNFDEVSKLFKEAENSDDPFLSDDFHGRLGPLGVTTHRESHPIKEAIFKACEEEFGLQYSDQNDGNHWGYFDMMSSTKHGRRVSSFNAFLEPNLHRENLDVLLHAHVTKVLIENGHAVGVLLVRDGLQRIVRASREVVLSAGALRTPQLLLLSGIGDREHLEQHQIPVVHHLPGVGKNFQDHYGFTGLLAEIPDEGIPDLHSVEGLHQWLVNQTGPFAYPSGLQMGLMYVTTGDNGKRADAEIIPIAIKNFVYETNLRKDVFMDFYGPLHGKSTLSMFVLIQHPDSRGEVRLASSDATAQPYIDPKYYSHPADLEKAVKAGRQALQLMRSNRMRSVNVTLYKRPFPSCAHLELFSDDYLRCLATHHTLNAFHPCGTCRIGKDPLAVVDERLRVHGVRGIRIADNSIMPEITTGHLNAPAIMIGSKAGQLILEDYSDIVTTERQEL